MNINYNVTGDRRKALVKAISEYLETAAVYNGAPTFSYTAGVYTIDRYGTVSYPEHASREFADRMTTALAEQGFSAESSDGDNDAEAEAYAECEMRRMNVENQNVPDFSHRGQYGGDDIPDFEDLRMTEREELGLGRERRDPQGENGMQVSDVPEPDADDRNRLTVEVPREGFSDEALENLRKIIASKETVIQKALGLNDLPFNEDCLAVEVLDDKLRFPWFTLSGVAGEADAYSRFVCAICKMAKEQKRVTAKEHDAENDKFVMRIFLIRLGLKGPENKLVRQLMLKTLSGNSSWKSGQRPAKAAENTDGDSGNAAHEASDAMADAQLIHDANVSTEQNDIGEKQ